MAGLKPLARVIVSCVFLILFFGSAFFSLTYLEDNMQLSMRAVVGMLILLFAIMTIQTKLMKYALSFKGQFKSYSSMLVSKNAFLQSYAIQQLALVVGNRFGSPNPFRRSAHNLRCRMWRKWLAENSDDLVWNPVLGCYVESDLDSDASELNSKNSA